MKVGERYQFWNDAKQFRNVLMSNDINSVIVKLVLESETNSGTLKNKSGTYKGFGISRYRP